MTAWHLGWDICIKRVWITQKTPRTSQGLPVQPVPSGARTATAAWEHFAFYDLALKPLEEKQLTFLPTHLHRPPVNFWVMYAVSSEQHRSTNGKQAPVYFSGWQFTLSLNPRSQRRAQAGGSKIPPSQRAPSPPRDWDHFHKRYWTKPPPFPGLCKQKGFGVRPCSYGTAVGGLTFSTWGGVGGTAVPAVTAASASCQRQDGAKPQEAVIDIATRTANTLMWVSLSTRESWHLTNLHATEGHPFSSHHCWHFYTSEVSMICIEFCVWFRASLSPQNSPLSSSLMLFLVLLVQYQRTLLR